jgi:hypothetical protein
MVIIQDLNFVSLILAILGGVPIKASSKHTQMFSKKIGNCPKQNFGVLFCNTLSTHFITLLT